MGHLPLALSVHHFITSVGSDAGFASIIGLAILVLLYFAHARETAALREQAEEASMRIQQLEARLAQAARQPATAQPAPAPLSAAQQGIAQARQAPAASAPGR